MMKNILISAILLGSATIASATGVMSSSVSSPFYVSADVSLSRVKTTGPWVKLDENKAAKVNKAGDVETASKAMSMYGVNFIAGYKMNQNIALEVETGFHTGSVSQTVFEGTVTEGVVVLPTPAIPAVAPVCTEKAKLRDGKEVKTKLKLNRIPLFVNAKWEDSINDSFGYYAKVGVGVEILSGKGSKTTSLINDEITGGTCAAPTIEDKGDKKATETESAKLKTLVRPAIKAELGLNYNITDNVAAFVGVGLAASKTAKMKASVKDDVTGKTESQELARVGGIVPFIKAGVTVSF